MLTRVGDEKLANIPLVEDVRRELLEDAVQLYGQFLDEAPIDPRVRLETAMTERRLVQSLFHLGRTSQAESSIERSIALLRQVSNESPNSEQLQLELARSLMWRRLRDQLGHPPAKRPSPFSVDLVLHRCDESSRGDGVGVCSEQDRASSPTTAVLSHVPHRHLPKPRVSLTICFRGMSRITNFAALTPSTS